MSHEDREKFLDEVMNGDGDYDEQGALHIKHLIESAIDRLHPIKHKDYLRQITDYALAMERTEGIGI